MLCNAVLYLVQSSSIKGRFVQDCLLILSKCKCSIFLSFLNFDNLFLFVLKNYQKWFSDEFQVCLLPHDSGGCDRKEFRYYYNSLEVGMSTSRSTSRTTSRSTSKSTSRKHCKNIVGDIVGNIVGNIVGDILGDILGDLVG